MLDNVNPPAHKVGDTVHVTRETSPTHFGTFTVEKVNPATYGLTRVGGGRKLKAGHSLVGAGPLPAQVVAPLARGPIPANLAHEMSINVGTVVNIVSGARGVSPDDLYVVTGETARGYRLFLLGGKHGGRYYTSIPARCLRVVSTIDGWEA